MLLKLLFKHFILWFGCLTHMVVESCCIPLNVQVHCVCGAMANVSIKWFGKSFNALAHFCSHSSVGQCWAAPTSLTGAPVFVSSFILTCGLKAQWFSNLVKLHCSLQLCHERKTISVTTYVYSIAQLIGTRFLSFGIVPAINSQVSLIMFEPSSIKICFVDFESSLWGMFSSPCALKSRTHDVTICKSLSFIRSFLSTCHCHCTDHFFGMFICHHLVISLVMLQNILFLAVIIHNKFSSGQSIKALNQCFDLSVWAWGSTSFGFLWVGMHFDIESLISSSQCHK